MPVGVVVPSPLSLKLTLTPSGRVPLAFSGGIGLPVAVTVNELFRPTEKRGTGWAGLVIASGWATVIVNVPWEAVR